MYKSRNIYLSAFYNLELYPSFIRFEKQAKELGVFDNMFIYNEFNLPKDEKFERFLRKKLIPSRGFGYWCWKPFIALKTLENIEDGDILVYADIGCYLNKDGKERFYKYLDVVIENGGLCFTLDGFLEKVWTKSDLLNYFGKLEDKNITDTNQILSGAFILEKNSNNIELCSRWLQTYYDDFSLADDAPSKIPNLEGFMENRHDQSIFSILSKIYNIYTMNGVEVGTNDKEHPIITMRDKRNIYFDSINKVAWWIPKSKERNNFRNRFMTYSENFMKYYYGIENCSNDKVSKIGFIDFILKFILRYKIKKYIKKNKELIDKIMHEASKYK